MTIGFFAAGRPRTKGNVHAFLNKAGRITRTEASKKTRPWMGVISHAAGEAGVRRSDGVVDVAMMFLFARPASHYGTGRNAGVLKGSASGWPLSRSTGDLDKLVRAVLDALTGIAYADDSQVCVLSASKRYVDQGELEGVQVLVGESMAPSCHVGGNPCPRCGERHNSA